jgi:hypothetical protein
MIPADYFGIKIDIRFVNNNIINTTGKIPAIADE